MPLLGLILLALAALSARAAESSAQPYPHWDGSESIEQYAKRANLPPTQTLDLGDGVKLELALIPAGKFLMGTPEPEKVDGRRFNTQICIGVVVTNLCIGSLFVMLAFALARTKHKKHRPQTSLGGMLVFVLIASIALGSGLHWYFSARALADARIEYEAALARFKSSYETEKPAHEVVLTKPYYLGKFEVTQEQYQQVMGSNPSGFKGRELPVEQVSWNDAQEFCRKASAKAGGVVRLPTEAEWECACRAGTKSTYYTGDSDADLDRAGWYDGNSKNTTHPVGQKIPNAWGLYDMHGNVWEWCADRFEMYKVEAVVDPMQGAFRVLRGGSWFYCLAYCRSASRIEFDPDIPNGYVGFRVLVAVPGTP